jgi:hypothetical protein
VVGVRVGKTWQEGGATYRIPVMAKAEHDDTFLLAENSLVDSETAVEVRQHVTHLCSIPLSLQAFDYSLSVKSLFFQPPQATIHSQKAQGNPLLDLSHQIVHSYRLIRPPLLATLPLFSRCPNPPDFQDFELRFYAASPPPPRSQPPWQCWCWSLVGGGGGFSHLGGKSSGKAITCSKNRRARSLDLSLNI